MMEVKSHVKMIIFLIWILIVPFGMWYAFQSYPPHLSGRWLDAFAFLLLTCLVASMPIVINDMFIFLLQWVALAVFLEFGLFAEIVMAQIAVLVLLFRLGVL